MGPVGVTGWVQRALHPSTPALTAAAWVLGLVATGLIAGSPYLVFGYHSPSLHLVLDAVDACIALLVAFLLVGQFLRGRRLQELLLADALMLLALAGLGMDLFTELVGRETVGSFEVWGSLSVRVSAAALVAVAALLGARLSQGIRRAHTVGWLAVACLLALLWLLRDRLPAALDQSPPASAVDPVITGHPLLLTAQALTALGFLLASFAFAQQAVRSTGELLRWLGPACALAGFARVNYVLFPSLYSDWIYTGDLLRTASYALLLVGAAREIGRYWSAQARAAVLDDRRRLARELHDGVVQELGYIRAEAHVAPGDPEAVDRIIAACDRALDEARAAVDALGRASDEPLGFVLHRAARQVAERYGGHIVVDLDDGVDAGQGQRHALVRITREAVSNGLRHGGARRILIRLVRDQHIRRLVIQDDGRGFEPRSASHSTGFGLTSMRERAAGLPGSFEMDSAPGRGTTVVVTW